MKSQEKELSYDNSEHLEKEMGVPNGARWVRTLKKFTSFALTLAILLLCMVGCSNTANNDNESDKSSSQQDSTDKGSESDASSNQQNSAQTPIPEPASTPLALNSEVTTGLDAFDSVILYKMTVTEPGLFEPTMIAPKNADGSSAGIYYITMYTKEGYLKEKHEQEVLWEPQKILCYDQLYTLCRYRLGVGEYFIEISGDHTSKPETDFTLNTHFTGEGRLDNVEKEWNDSFETATPIKLNTTYTGNISLHTELVHDDVDYFTFTLTEETVVHLEPKVGGTNNTYTFSLYDENHSSLMNTDVSSYSYGDAYDTFTCKTFRLAPGTYYVSVQLFGTSWDTTIDYYLTVVTE